MKPKKSDVCPVCNCKSISTGPGQDDEADISWIRCDICRQWYHNLCLPFTASRLAQLASFHCSECEETHGPSPMKRQSKRARVKIDYVALDQGETFAVDKSVHPHVPSFIAFQQVVDFSEKSPGFVDVLTSQELNKEYVFSTGLTRPVVVHNVTSETGLHLPRPRNEITVAYIAEKTGTNEPVEVMDVLSQQSESPSWSLRQWKDYFYTPESERDRIRNVISLEVSQVHGLGTNFVRPKVVTDMDLVDKVWCDVDGHGQIRPQVTVYCLMSVRGSYTDFHIDFSGTPVYYTVCHGTKTFLMYPPTPENLMLYESWCHEPQQNFIWFAEYTKRIGGKKIKPSTGFKVNLTQGDLFIIPSGWIHSVYTPDDAVIIGGNYLTLRDLPMHTTIYDIEKRTRVPSKYRFPMFNKVLWLTSWYYYNHKDEFLKDLGVDFKPVSSQDTISEPGILSPSELNDGNSQPELASACSSQYAKLEPSETNCIKNEIHENILDSNGKLNSENDSSVKLKDVASCMKPDLISKKRSSTALPAGSTSHPRDVLHSLITQLKEHYEASKTQPIAKKSIPFRLIGRNVKEYLENLESWLETF